MHKEICTEIHQYQSFPRENRPTIFLPLRPRLRTRLSQPLHCLVFVDMRLQFRMVLYSRTTRHPTLQDLRVHCHYISRPLTQRTTYYSIHWVPPPPRTSHTRDPRPSGYSSTPSSLLILFLSRALDSLVILCNFVTTNNAHRDFSVPVPFKIKNKCRVFWGVFILVPRSGSAAYLVSM